MPISIESMRIIEGKNQKALQDLSRNLAKEKSMDWSLINQPSTRFSLFLVYEDNKPIAFFRFFLFFDDKAEVIIYLAKAVDKEQLLKEVMKTLKEKLKPFKIKEICIKSDFIDSSLLKAQGFVEDYCELFMVKNIGPETMSFSVADKSMVSPLLVLDKACFKKDNHLDKNELLTQIDAAESDILIICKDNVLVAKAHLKKENHRATLTNLCVADNYRRQGISSVLVKHCHSWCVYHHVRFLELLVDKKNQPAIGLYLKYGFRQVKEVVYFKKDLC